MMDTLAPVWGSTTLIMEKPICTPITCPASCTEPNSMRTVNPRDSPMKNSATMRISIFTALSGKKVVLTDTEVHTAREKTRESPALAMAGKAGLPKMGNINSTTLMRIRTSRKTLNSSGENKFTISMHSPDVHGDIGYDLFRVRC